MKNFLVIFVILYITQPADSIFCSVFCSLKNCANGDSSPNGCTACNTFWVKVGSTCQPNTSADFFFFDKTADLGGGLVVTPNNSPSLQCGYTQFGAQKVNIPFRVKSTSGISASFSQIVVYFGIFTYDVGVASNSKWNYSNTVFTLTFTSGDGFTQTNSFSLMGQTFMIKENLCSTSNITEHWNKISQIYNFTTSNTSLTFDISTNQSNTTNQWGIKQFIIIYKGCNALCKTCFGSLSSQCTSCVYNATTNSSWLSGGTCSSTCAAGYGYSTNASFCVQCDPLCLICYDTSTFCMSCTVSGPNKAYFYDVNTSCLKSCPNPYYSNTTTQTCELCNVTCQTCIITANYCTSCATGYYLYSFVCYNSCPDGTFIQADNKTCANCDVRCTICSGPAVTSCTVCQTVDPYISYLYNTTNQTGQCKASCPTGTYAENFNGTGPNLCLGCNSSCMSCTLNAYNCQQCSAGYYLFNSTCYLYCPAGLFSYNSTNTGQCLDCDISCVDLQIVMSFSNSLNNQMYVDMVFSQNLNFTSFDYVNFQTITIDSGNMHYTLDMFSITYRKLSGSSYRIALKPKGYIFLYNATFTVTTRDQTNTTDYSLLLLPFKPSNYLKSKSLTWFLIQGPPFSQLQTNIMTSFATLSQKTNNFLDLPYVQEIKKSGIFNFLISGAQITSCSVLANQIQSQNLYEGVRFWAIFVFFDVPPYEQISNQTKNFVSPSVESKIRNALETKRNQEQPNDRRLFSTDVMYWRFQRTGQTSFFIYDCYVPVFLLILCWISLLVLYKIKKTRWYAKHASKVFSAVHKIHEISIMYVTMASIVQFIYFQTTSLQRFVSAAVCMLFNIYFVIYELYIYYDMLKYPLAEIGNNYYEYYVTRYGCFLKNIRYQEYYIHEKWSPRHWFRPYNFHFLSYYKKFVMMIALPLFYSSQYAQMSILLAVQLLQLLRVWFVQPFLSKARNYLRISLQIALALFFIVNIVQNYLLNKIQSGDINQMGKTIQIFYGVGWAGFCLCFYFNLTHIAIGIYDFITGLKNSSRSKMDNARKKYYYLKIRDYQKDNEAVSKQLVNKWVKLGNLHDQVYGQLPQINVRIEQYSMRMALDKFEVAVRKITELRLMSKRNYRKRNNTVTNKKIEKKGVLYQHKSPQLYKTLYDQFNKYANHHIEIVIIKTFLNVFQPDFQPGQQIPFDRSKMYQKIQLISYSNQKEERRVDELIEGFPIPFRWFQNF